MKLAKRYPQNMLKLIIQELMKEIRISGFEKIYENESSRNEMDFILKKFGITEINHEDYGFWAKLVLDNYNSLDGDLIIPKLSKYYVYIELDVRRNVSETYVQTVKSYLGGDEGQIQEMILSDEEFDYYSGDYVEDDVYDSEVNDWKIKSITPAVLKESAEKGKRLLENKEMRNKEIKELQKMKILIEERLRLLQS